jgi:KamA family protein
LVVTDDQLRLLIDDIASISHVQRLRIHSRLPIVIPQRITESLLQTITHANLDTIMVIHCNHVAEIDESVASALAALRGRGVTVLNQAVLLAGINDDIDTQVALSKGLFATGTLPYYLHLLDKVQGAAHFDVSEEKARELMTAMSARLPGFLVPRLVREVAGADAKVGVPNYN